MSTDGEILLRLVVALLLASVIGWERESIGKAAGLRTHILVGIGSALTVAIAGSLVDRFQTTGEGLRFDPIRIVEAVLASIGFLGAGTILFQQRRGRVSGLTTAASIWATAVVGLAVGAGRTIAAAEATALIFLVLRGLGYLERRHTRIRKPERPS